jgi:hypothetical protein
MDGSRVKCKNCRYNKKYILKHLSKSTECNESYSKKEIVDLEKLSKSNQDLNRREKYNPQQRAERYQIEKQKISEKYKRDKQTIINERRRQRELQTTRNNDKSIEELKKNVFDKHLALKEQTTRKFIEINYWPTSMSKEILDIKEDIQYQTSQIDEEIESSALRAKYLDFDFRLVTDLFQELMTSIENNWFEINERIATVFEDSPLMKDGVKLFKQK